MNLNKSKSATFQWLDDMHEKNIAKAEERRNEPDFYRKPEIDLETNVAYYTSTPTHRTVFDADDFEGRN